MQYEIIDFHTHPFLTNDQNICSHTEFCNMSVESTKSIMNGLGITRICGSVIDKSAQRGMPESWEVFNRQNETAYRLAEIYKGFYIPGIQIHPSFLKESCQEIERASAMGIRLIGELVPYWHGWSDYSCDDFDVLLECATAHNMVVSFHSIDNDQMDYMVKKHPDTVFVAAHPGEYSDYMRHLERMKMSRNYYLDTSGYGLFRFGMLRHGIKEYGAERFVFGSDYPTCAPAMYVGGVLLDELISDDEKRLIFADNSKRLLGL